MGGKRKRGSKDASDPSKKSKMANGGARGATAAAAVTQSTKPSLEPAPFVESPVGDERRREAGLYELLGSEDEKERLQAAGCIVSSLLDGEGVDESVLERHLNRRLFRGLASGRNASRLGFSLVITEILSQLFGAGGGPDAGADGRAETPSMPLCETRYKGLTFDAVIGSLMDKTAAGGNIPGQEERDHYFGQLFGLTCFVRSRVLFSPPSRWHTVLDLVLRLAYQKVWMRSQCGWIIVQALDQMDGQQAAETLERVAGARLARTPEGVAIWLAALERFPRARLDRIKPWENPLAPKSLCDMASVLKESFQQQQQQQQTSDGPPQANKQANWTAQLHFVWDTLLAHFAKETVSAQDFDQFWIRVVDDGLFSKSATDGQKFKGFMVFQKMLTGLVDQPAKIACLFSKNFMSCLMNQAAKKDRFVHRSATKALGAMEATAASHPASLPVILRGLLGKNGAYAFDQRTNTKTTDKLLRSMDATHERECLDVIRQPIGKLAKMEEADARSTLRTYVDHLSRSLSNPETSSSPSSAENNGSGLALQELARLAYAKPADILGSLLTEPVRSLCRSRLESSFAKLIRQSGGMAVFCRAVASIDPTAVSMEGEIKGAVDGALSRMTKLLGSNNKSSNSNKRKPSSKKNDEGLSSPTPVAQGLAVLHAVSILQLYNEEPDAMEVLEDLEQFTDRLKRGKLDEEGASELLVEILLSMIARPSSLMRAVSQQVFESFTPQITPEGLQLLTGPLASSESTKGQKELFSTEDDEAMDVDDDEEEDDESGSDDDDEKGGPPGIELDSDVEFVDLDEEKDFDDGSDNEDDEDDDDDDDKKKEKKKNKKNKDSESLRIDIDDELGNILKSHRLDLDDEAESSEDEQDMTDEQMLAMDGKLSEVLKQSVRAHPASKQKKDAKQTVVNFKHRILDLVNIYVRKEAANPAALSLLLPLLNLMRSTTRKDLASRSADSIRQYQAALKKARSGGSGSGSKEDPDKEEGEGEGEEGDEGEVNELISQLIEIHEEAAKDDSHAYAKAASSASLIVASTMFAIDRSSIRKVAAVYAKTWSDWVLGQGKVQSSFFQEWYNWSQNMASRQQSS
ncbi:DNA polymerase phi [Geosmithia morbida]|uniref:DNA polymerase phi n=1 Tax=Geosmithia morbida TaxID=1094350 RepID=A0A9P5D2J5_9HYPO|nr:DNA polymerase phi [Geosmithia morbida]KAF4123932.1 DNA polymerase phi [Geosmithia morbida]